MAKAGGNTRNKGPVSVSASGGASKFSDLDDALRWLDSRVNVERSNLARLDTDLMKLDRMRELTRILGEPQREFKSVHIAGTKGKGSTCEMTAGCLEGCGYTVGVYTSPHLVDVRERIRINRRLIDAADFVRVAQRVAAAAGEMPAGIGEATFFEVMTAMAFLHFAEQAVDVGVVEVGLGGRLDATNVIQPEVAAVTSISLDHTQILGDTVEKIAKEKGGIYKPGATALTIQQKPGVIEVLRACASGVGQPLRVVGEDVDFSVRFEASASQGPHMRVGLTTARNAFEHIAVPLKGEHQAFNCGLALAIVDALSERGLKVSEPKVTKGLASVTMPGRMEIVRQGPRVLLDGAHNAESMKCLMKAIGAQVPYDSMIVIFGCAGDKDIAGMLSEISHGADKVIFTKTAGSARAADPAELARRFTEDNEKMSQVAPTLHEAIVLASRGVGRDDLICITGSLHLVGEAKRLLQGAKPLGMSIRP